MILDDIWRDCNSSTNKIGSIIFVIWILSNHCLVVSENKNNPTSFSVIMPRGFPFSTTINLLRLCSNNFLITSEILEFFRIEMGLLEISETGIIEFKLIFHKNNQHIFHY